MQNIKGYSTIPETISIALCYLSSVSVFKHDGFDFLIELKSTSLFRLRNEISRLITAVCRCVMCKCSWDHTTTCSQLMHTRRAL